jgi:hypothetical protein
MKKFLVLSITALLMLNCKSSEEFTGFSYDPPNVTNTQDRKVKPQYRRIIGAGDPTVWVSNQFEGARSNDFYAINDSTFEVFIEPENAPINNSPWFAFSIWSDTTRSATLRLNYKDAKHRYVPKITVDDSLYSIDMSKAIYDTLDNALEFKIQLDKIPKTISAQLITDSNYYNNWLSSFEDNKSVEINDIGYSKLGNPIKELTITDTKEGQKAGVLILMSRQHPPEVTGFLASQFFIEELSSNSELAKRFRTHFITRAFPLINIDGVLNGHWRHNAGGVDLNRDWENFNQPETQAVRDALLPILNEPKQKVYYGIDFHSTNENIFYPIEQTVKTDPDDITQRWFPLIKADNPAVRFVSEEFDTSSPISKNWMYKTFGSDALTFEMNDALDDETIEQVARSSARILMSLLLDEMMNSESN